MLNNCYKSYFKIKKVAESCETVAHIESLGNMINNFIRNNLFIINKMYNYAKKKLSYKKLCEARRFEDSVSRMENNLTVMFNGIVEQYNKNIIEQEDHPQYPEVFKVKGFQCKKKRKKK